MNTNNVGTIFRDCTLRNFVDGRLRKRFNVDDETYNTMLTALQNFPDYNALVIGRAGEGKTTLLTVLYERGLRKWARKSYENLYLSPSVWKTTAQKLAREFHTAAMWQPKSENDPRPQVTVTENKIVAALKNNLVPRLFLDEFDKYKASEFQNNNIFELINMVQSNGGQVVCCANANLSLLMERIGDQHNIPILRRLVDSPGGLCFDLFEGKIYINWVRHILKDGELRPTNEVLDLAGTAKVAATRSASSV
jgi:DNA replication protein DnaC